MLLPLILRMAKRSPDAVLGSAARVLALLRLDLGQHAAPVVADLQPLLRHVKPPTRCAPSAARRRTHAPRAPRASLCSAQVGRGGRGGGAGGAERRPGRAARRARGGPGRPGRRRRAAAARRARAPGPGPGGRRAGGGAGRRARRRGRGGSRRRPPVRAVSVRGARSLLRGRGQAAGAPRSRVRPRREEANEEVRLAIVAALGAWLGRLAAWPPCALARMNDGLAEREPLRRAHLRALVQARARRRPAAAPSAAALQAQRGATAVHAMGAGAARLPRGACTGGRPGGRAGPGGQGRARQAGAARGRAAGAACGGVRGRRRRRRPRRAGARARVGGRAAARLRAAGAGCARQAGRGGRAAGGGAGGGGAAARARPRAQHVPPAVRRGRICGAALTWLRAQLAQQPGVHAAPAAARLLLACLLHPDAGVRREAAASAARCAAAPDLPAVLIGALLDMLRDAPRLAVRRAAAPAPKGAARGRAMARGGPAAAAASHRLAPLRRRSRIRPRPWTRAARPMRPSPGAASAPCWRSPPLLPAAAPRSAQSRPRAGCWLRTTPCWRPRPHRRGRPCAGAAAARRTPWRGRPTRRWAC